MFWVWCGRDGARKAVTNWYCTIVQLTTSILKLLLVVHSKFGTNEQINYSTSLFMFHLLEDGRPLSYNKYRSTLCCFVESHISGAYYCTVLHHGEEWCGAHSMCERMHLGRLLSSAKAAPAKGIIVPALFEHKDNNPIYTI